MIWHSSCSRPDYGVFTGYFCWSARLHAPVQTTVFARPPDQGVFHPSFLMSATVYALLQTTVYSRSFLMNYFSSCCPADYGVFTSHFWWSTTVHTLLQTTVFSPGIFGDILLFMLSSRLRCFHQAFLIICYSSCYPADYDVFSPFISYDLLQIMLSSRLRCFHQAFLMISCNSCSPPNYGLFTIHFWWPPAVHALLQTTVSLPIRRHVTLGGFFSHGHKTNRSKQKKYRAYKRKAGAGDGWCQTVGLIRVRDHSNCHRANYRQSKVR